MGKEISNVRHYNCVMIWSVNGSLALTKHTQSALSVTATFTSDYRLLTLYCEIVVVPSSWVGVAELGRLRLQKIEVQR